MSKTFKLSAALLIIVFTALLVFEGVGKETGSSFSRKINDEGQVTVNVEPIISDSGMEIVIFMDTHTVDLEENLKEVSYIESNGQRYDPVEWIGDPPGGHHRAGSLIFKNEFSDFTLHIESIGGESKKFNWK